MNKTALDSLKDQARRLRESATNEAMLSVFPDKHALLAFYDAVKHETHPESYGQTPYEHVITLAVRVRNGLCDFWASRYLEDARKRAEWGDDLHTQFQGSLRHLYLYVPEAVPAALVQAYSLQA